MISRTLAIAAGVNVTGVDLGASPVTTSGVTDAVDIRKSPFERYISSICDHSGRGKQTDTPYVMKRTPCRMHRDGVPGHPIVMKPLRFLVDAFVNTFGITQPTPETEVRAGRFIAIMLGAVLLLLVAAIWLAQLAFSH
jgi:hypothetical protein